MQYSLTITSVLILIAMAIPGFLLIKSKMIKENAIACLSVVLLFINQPAFTLYSFQTKEFSSHIVSNMFLVAGISLLLHLIMIAIAHFIMKLDKNKMRGDAYVFAASFGNIGFMGLPFIRLLMPDNPDVVLYLAIMFVIFNLLAWTVGIYIISGDKKYISFKKAIINPPTLALFIAIPLFVLNIKLPEPVMFPIKYLSDMIVPLSMLILGMRFGVSKFNALFSDWGLYVSSLLKLVVTPLIALGIMKLINLDYIVMETVFILMAMPSATMGLILAENFGGDKDASAKAILGSSIISIITIPLILLLI